MLGTARALEAGRRDRSSTSDTILTNFRPRRPTHQVFSQMDPGMIENHPIGSVLNRDPALISGLIFRPLPNTRDLSHEESCTAWSPKSATVLVIVANTVAHNLESGDCRSAANDGYA